MPNAWFYWTKSESRISNLSNSFLLFPNLSWDERRKSEMFFLWICKLIYGQIIGKISHWRMIDDSIRVERKCINVILIHEKTEKVVNINPEEKTIFCVYLISPISLLFIHLDAHTSSLRVQISLNLFSLTQFHNLINGVMEVRIFTQTTEEKKNRSTNITAWNEQCEMIILIQVCDRNRT